MAIFRDSLKNKSFTKIKYADKTNASIPLQFKLTKLPVDLRSHTNGNFHSITFGSFRSYSINWLFYGIYFFTVIRCQVFDWYHSHFLVAKTFSECTGLLSSHSLSPLGSLLSKTGLGRLGMRTPGVEYTTIAHYRYFNMTPRSSGQDWKFVKILLIPISLI